MTDQLTLDDALVPPPSALARVTDVWTSHAAARKLTARSAHLARILDAYRDGIALTDVEAAAVARVERIEATRRASDLRNAKLIEPVMVDGKLATAVLPTGRRGMLCRITEAGRAELARIDAGKAVTPRNGG